MAILKNQMVYQLHQLHQQLCQLYQLQISHPIKSQLYQINYVNGQYQISHPISDPLVRGDFWGAADLAEEVMGWGSRRIFSSDPPSSLAKLVYNYILTIVYDTYNIW